MRALGYWGCYGNEIAGGSDKKGAVADPAI